MHKSQQKIMRHMEEQKNMAQSKERYYSPETNPKKVEFHETLAKNSK